MERMKELIVCIQNEYEGKVIYRTELYTEEEYKELEEENINLKEENDRLKNNAMEDMRVQTKLEEKIRFLEECLDNKEKVNKSLREELSAYDREYFDEDKKAKNIFIDKNGKVVSGGEFRELC